MTANNEPIVIIGAGHGGASAAAFLRQNGWGEAIILISDEAFLPYQRPPLSKAWLKGELPEGKLDLRAAKFYTDQGIEFRRNTRVTAIDPKSNSITLGDGSAQRYKKLIIATGARAKVLPLDGARASNLFSLRTRTDADAINAALKPGQRLAIIGGGYIGLEIAATARHLDLDVTVFESLPRLLARVASPQLSSFVQSYHENHSVQFALNASVAGVQSAGDTVTGLILSEGHEFPCDTLIVGIGAAPNIDLAERAGLACGDGIIVNENARTNEEDIYAIGDCTWRPLPHYGIEGRLESVPNALEQAKQAAAHICGKPAPVPEAPWFWSDQYDLRLQIAGLLHDVHSSVCRGNPTDKGFAIFHLGAENEIRAVEAVNDAKSFMAGRMLLAKGRRLDPRKISDTEHDIRDLAA